MSKPGTGMELGDAYQLIAVLWCCPPESDAEYGEIRRSAQPIVDRLAEVDGGSADLLARFLAANPLSEEEYIELFELNPKCALYLGSHSYEEPTTCANAAMSDRNEYMIELAAIYRHFGQVTNGIELPDYLPLMVDFLALTSEQSDDPVRDKLIREYFQPYLPPMRETLKALDTPYLDLLDALARILELELTDIVHVQSLTQPSSTKVEFYDG